MIKKYSLFIATFLVSVLSFAEIGVVYCSAIEPSPGMNSTGVYLTIINNGEEAVQLVGASTSISDRVELHNMKMENDVMTMFAVPEINVPANSQVELKRGGLHVMMFDITRNLVEGDWFTMTFEFSDGTTKTRDIQVRKRQPMAM